MPNVSAETKWLAYYVMLSRVRSLDNFLCHGLPEREMLESGPPETLQKAMAELFEGKIATTFESCRMRGPNLVGQKKGAQYGMIV